MPHGFSDGLLNLVWLTPFRCNGCSYRFYRFRHAWARFAAPAALVCVLLLMVVVAVNVRPWLRDAKRALRQIPKQAVVDSQADRTKIKAR